MKLDIKKEKGHYLIYVEDIDINDYDLLVSVCNSIKNMLISYYYFIDNIIFFSSALLEGSGLYSLSFETFPVLMKNVQKVNADIKKTIIKWKQHLINVIKLKSYNFKDPFILKKGTVLKELKLQKHILYATVSVNDVDEQWDEEHFLKKLNLNQLIQLAEYLTKKRGGN